MILFGISTCDTCKKAIKAIENAGKTVEFRDVRREPLSETELTEMIIEFGDRLINKQSTTYRGMSDWLKASEAEEQIKAQPTVMKRPIIRRGTQWFLGWDDAVQQAVLQ